MDCDYREGRLYDMLLRYSELVEEAINYRIQKTIIHARFSGKRVFILIKHLSTLKHQLNIINKHNSVGSSFTDFYKEDFQVKVAFGDLSCNTLK